MFRTQVIIVSLLIAASSHAYQHKYALGLEAGIARLDGGKSAHFPFQKGYGLQFAYFFKERWTMSFDVSRYTLYNDTISGSTMSLTNSGEHADRQWRATRLGAVVGYDLFSPERYLNVNLGLGGGLAVWKVVDPVTDSVWKKPGVHNETIDYAATEIFLTARTGTRLELSSRWSLQWNLRADYLTGVGAEFDAAVMSERDDWLFGSMVTLNFSFGRVDHSWSSRRSWSSSLPEDTEVIFRKGADSDGDGVPDAADQCPNTPPGAVVNLEGCMLDSDRDGISDGLDDCPRTDPRARGVVDIHGCPVDSDFDGVPDYLDKCPDNQVGAMVDSVGCPIDSDADGVPDGLDDCPNTLFGVEVDPHGCIDLSMMAKPMVLNIDYVPGSFEIDTGNRERIKTLARLLVFVPDIKLEISGYTDNVGIAVANKKLSAKRARRVRDYMLSLGVDTGRIKVFGRGETNFVASNQTAAGRAKNRRVEILFYL